MKIIRLFLLLIFISVFCHSFAQKKEKPETLSRKFVKGAENKATLDKADHYFNTGDLLTSLPYYEMVEKVYPDELYLKFRIGSCYLIKKDEHSKAQSYLEKVFKEKPRLANINLLMGEAYFYNYKFDQALEQFNLFLMKNKDKDQLPIVQHFIDNCNNGKELVNSPVEVEIKNIGAPINTDAMEYAPVLTSDESVLMFTYRGPKSTGGLQNENLKPDPNGEYFEDIMVSNKELGKWTEPVSIGTNVNGKGHDACIALSNDGQKLFIYKFSKKDLGDIYVSTLEGNVWSVPKRLKGDVNTDFWEGSASLSSDQQTLYFASSNPRGYGGKDIYKATLMPDGSWGHVQNLGNQINTSEDDDGPFIHPNGKTLIFSSKGHNSMGGYDIFRSDLINDSVWGTPVNMGYPINTIDDEVYYFLSADGKTGYYSSSKPGGKGGQDIYTIEPGLASKIVLTLVKGVVMADGKPAEADITVEYSDPNKKYSHQSEFKSNSLTGKYLINFPPGNIYKVTFHVDGFKDHVEMVDVTEVEEFEVKILPISFSTQEDKAEQTANSLNAAKQKQAELAKMDSLANLKQQQLASAKADSMNFNEQRLQAKKAKMDSAMAVEQRKSASAKTDSMLLFQLQKRQLATADSILLAQHQSEKERKYADSLLLVKQQRSEMAKKDSMNALQQKKTRMSAEDSILLVQQQMQAARDRKQLASADSLALIKQRESARADSLKAVELAANSANTKQGNKSAEDLDFRSFIGKNLNDPAIYRAFLEKAGAISLDDLIFKVQIGAYRHPKNFKYANLNEFGPAEIIDYPDKITRFTMKTFKTIAEAEVFRQQVIKKGTKDAWITAVYKGERKLLQELILLNFYKGNAYVQ